MSFERPLSPLEREILFLLTARGAMNRDEMIHILHRPRTTIYDQLRRLEERGVILRYPVLNNKRGRPVIYWQVKEEAS